MVAWRGFSFDAREKEFGCGDTCPEVHVLWMEEGTTNEVCSRFVWDASTACHVWFPTQYPKSKAMPCVRRVKPESEADMALGAQNRIDLPSQLQFQEHVASLAVPSTVRLSPSNVFETRSAAQRIDVSRLETNATPTTKKPTTKCLIFSEASSHLSWNVHKGLLYLNALHWYLRNPFMSAFCSRKSSCFQSKSSRTEDLPAHVKQR